MIYTDRTKKAIKLCYKAHAGQVDKSGLPYVHHPLHLADQMDDEASTIVALLHDVVEDTQYTFNDLAQMGFGDEVLAALRLLTHDDSVPYLDYVREIAKNPLATKVKLADLAHNSDLTRLNHEPTETDLERVRKYQKAREILQSNLCSNDEGQSDSAIVLEPLNADLSVCKVEDYSQVDISRPFCFTGATDEELSLVCPVDMVPENTTHRDDGWRAFRIVGTLDFSLIGILAGISGILATNGIGIFAISTYNTDYILTKAENYDAALKVLAGAGYTIR